MLKKVNPYGINLKNEYKIYRRTCKGEKPYKNYLSWRNHILKLISDMKIEDLENFRRLCLFRESTEKQGISVFATMISIFIPIYISDVVVEGESWVTKLILYSIIVFVSTIFVAGSYFSYTLSKDYYRDLSEIIQAKIDSMPEEEKLLIINYKTNEVLK